MSRRSKRTALLVCGVAVGAAVLVLVLRGQWGDERAREAQPDDSIESLVSALSAADSDTRATAAERLGRSGDQARLAAGRLEEILLGDESSRVRRAAAGALGSIGVTMVRNPPTGAAIFGVLSDPQLEKLTGALLRATEARDEGVRQSAADALVEVGTVAIEPLAWKYEDANGRAYAEARALGNLGPAAAPILLHVLRGQNPSAWVGARTLVSTLKVKLDDEQKKTLGRLCRVALGTPDPKVRGAAIDLLRWFRNREPETVADLRRALTDETGTVRAAAASALGSLGLEDPAVAKDLAAVLTDRDPEVRVAALGALREFGPRAGAEVARVCRALKDEDAPARAAAATVLGAMAPNGTEAIQPLTEALGDWNADVRASAARALGAFGPAADRSVAPLLATLKKSGPPEPPTGLNFSYTPPDVNAPIRVAIVEALARIAPGDPAVVAVMVEALADPSDGTTEPAIQALVKIGRPAVKPLIGLLAAPDDRVRRHAAEALGGMGSIAREAVETLRTVAAMDRDDRVRSEAETALQKIAPANPHR